MALGLAAFYPVPDRARAEGVLHLKQQGIYAREAGWVVRHASIGSRVKAGQELAKLENPELETQREQTAAELREAEIKRDKAQAEEAQAVAAAEAAKARATKEKLAELDRRLARLTILAPQDGLFYAQPLDGMEGVWIEAGHPLGQVVDPQETRIYAALTQDSGARIVEADKSKVEARLREAPGCQEDGTLEAFAIEGRKELPAQALADQAGGGIALDPHEQGKTQRHITQAVVRLQGQGDLPRVDGLPVEVRFHLGRTPALRMLWRWTLAQFQRRDR